MAKGTKKRAMIYSNVKANKKKAEEITKIRDEQINLNDEFIIGLTEAKKDNKIKNSKIQNNKIQSKKVQKNNKSNNKSSGKKNVKKSKKSKFKKRIIKLVVMFILFSGIIIGIIAFLKSSIFNIKTINVKINNNTVLTDSKIKELSEIAINQNIYSINKKKAIESIKTNPYIESVKISRLLPSTVNIEISERKVKFLIEQDSQYLYIDEQGYILDQKEDKNDCMIINGCSTTDLSIGNRLNSKDIESLSVIMKIVQISEKEEINFNDCITGIDISDNKNYKIYFDELGKIAYLGDDTYLNEKLANIKKILESESDYEGEIFVNVDFNKGEYPYFREKV